MTARPCRNCALLGREARCHVGHTCVDIDPCERCGGPRMLRVTEVFAAGGATRERSCEGCRRQQRQEVA